MVDFSAERIEKWIKTDRTRSESRFCQKSNRGNESQRSSLWFVWLVTYAKNFNENTLNARTSVHCICRYWVGTVNYISVYYDIIMYYSIFCKYNIYYYIWLCMAVDRCKWEENRRRDRDKQYTQCKMKIPN